MASNGYPKIPVKAWRTLRAKAASAPSTKFTASTVAALMGMANPGSARDNIVTPLRRVGLIDEDGGLTPRGNKWRVDASYGEACDEILTEVYPEDLAALRNGSGEPDLQAVKRWFDHQGFGDSNAKQMAATYALIASKQIPEPPAEQNGNATRKSPARKQSAATPKARDSEPKPKEKVEVEAPPRERVRSGAPNVHLDIQIHIPADASVEQIDQIFESMARHLYNQ